MGVTTKSRSLQKKPNPVDVHVGTRIRSRRTKLGISQEKLGSALGVTFQQVQKYEKGSNRVGAGRLKTISEILDVQVSYFFDDDSNASEPNEHQTDNNGSEYLLRNDISTKEGVELNRAFAKIKNPAIRAKILQLVQTIAEGMEVDI